MKNFRFLTLLFAMLSLFAVSCDNEPIDPTLNNGENPENPGNQLGTFSVDFDGRTYSTTTASVTSAGAVNLLVAAGANGESFIISLDQVAVGVYPANENWIMYTPDANDEEGSDYVSFDWENPEASTGSITISSVNAETGTISGTFSGTVFNDEGESIQLTNGVFTNIPYDAPEFPLIDNFAATVNGTSMEFHAVGSAESGSDLTITGTNIDLGSVSIKMPADIAVGSYPVSSSIVDPVNIIVTDPSLGGSMLDSGTLTITLVTDDRIVGTFSGQGLNEDDEVITVTGGRFDVEL